MLNRRNFLIGTAILPVASGWAGLVQAGQSPVFARDGVAINGYDPVAYFTQSAPVQGDAGQSVQWMGAEWRFANSENKARFEAEPEAFAPQYGGYCAYAVSKGATAKTEPDAWTVQDGKLYLNYDTSVREIWRQDIPGNIARADANWPGVLN